MIREEEGRITTDDECMMIDFFFLFAYRGRDGGLGDGEFGGADGGYLIVFFLYSLLYLSLSLSPSLPPTFFLIIVSTAKRLFFQFGVVVVVVSSERFSYLAPS